MKIGIVISTNDPEVVWNAFRFGNTSLKARHEVTVFLINNGVEVEDIQSEKFNLDKQIPSFLDNEGQLLACGICLKTRRKEEPAICPISTLSDLLTVVEKSDKILTFG
ncbi:MAG: DsrE family protein [Candidatus Hodarchaeota archaeon]